MPRTDTLLHRWFEEVWNQANPDAIDRLLAPDCVIHGLPDAQGEELCGPEPFKIFWRQFRKDFPDIHVELNEVLVDGDLLAALCTAIGKHSGSGKWVRFTGQVLARHKDGKFAEAWNHFDFETMRQQLA
jgi:predicted ester cyclase